MTNNRIMKIIELAWFSCSVKGHRLGGLVLLLLCLAGCASNGNVALHQPVESLPTEVVPTVTHLEGESFGFVLNENSSLSPDSRLNFDQAVQLFRQGEFEQAILLFEGLIVLSPGVTAPYINLAMALAKVGKPEAAEENLKIALSLIPGHPIASNAYALLLRKTGRFAEAKNIYEESLKLFPEYLPVRRNLGILCDLYMNDPQCALGQFEQYSLVNPGDEEINLWVSELRLRIAP